MTAVERLADLKGHVEHLEKLLAKHTINEQSLATDRSLRNDVLFSLLMACQAVIDVAGEIASRHGLRFQDYTEAVRALGNVPRFSNELVSSLEPLPGFRNVLIHEYVALDASLVVEALSRLQSLQEFIGRAAEELGDAD
jgi:uncharacterized protein YutE (UPF0331/DUF86 family)